MPGQSHQISKIKKFDLACGGQGVQAGQGSLPLPAAMLGGPGQGGGPPGWSPPSPAAAGGRLAVAEWLLAMGPSIA